MTHILNKQRKVMPEPVLAQIDMTRDLRGTFFAIGDWPIKQKQLQSLLEKAFKIKLHRGKNCFNSCFQFLENDSNSHLYRRFKVYNKVLQLL